ncbi:MAG: septal ring lytic transglycosylase RlpA family protein, partial [Chloroflexota bacterium]|nr:septal ring lytic transglycosylase RlpA family protein [Chloroflexota bacterium]
AVPRPATAAPVAAIGGGTLVLASWYGPGFYGNRTACGQTYTAQLQGVANLTLPCGTIVTLTYGGRTVSVPVIDRGPYVAGRTLDLSNATRLTLGCPDLCSLLMRVGN